jgi:hypothetical protein
VEFGLDDDGIAHIIENKTAFPKYFAKVYNFLIEIFLKIYIHFFF